MNGNVKFVGINLQFNELYDEQNIDFLKKLHSKQLNSLINGDLLDLSEPLNVHLQHDICLHYSNMSDKLKPQLHNFTVNFQGENVKIDEIIRVNSSKFFNALTPDQIFNILTDKNTLSIGKVLETKTNFYVERAFIDFEKHTGVVDMERNDELQLWTWRKEILKYVKNSTQIIAEGMETKIILLADVAGSGKSTTFRHLAVKLKM